MKSHKMTQELLQSAIRELQFSRLQTSHYEAILGEIEALTGDKLILKLIKNARERHNIDITCHYRSINNCG